MRIENPEVFSNQHFLFVFDLDGTLLNEKKTIEPKTKALLRLLSSYGNVVSIASGRPIRAILPYYQDLGLKGPVVAYNGAEIANPGDPAFPAERTYIRRTSLVGLLNAVGEGRLENVMTEDDTRQYNLRPNHAYDFFFHPEGMELHIGSIVENLSHDVLTAVLKLQDLSQQALVRDALEQIDPSLGIRFWYDAPLFGELFHYSVNKSTGIGRLASLYHIDSEHVFAFGDALNDWEMLKNAGVSFAMKNGAPQLKQMASYTTLEDNDHEGIYRTLVSFFGLKIAQ